jgi:hypothetical protein
MLEKDFFPYEQALALKELGFDEPCLAWFSETKKLQIAPETYKKWTGKPCNNSNIINVFNVDCISAPTFSQAFRWFREKYNLKDKYGVFPHHTIMYNYIIEGGKEEEAELACLKQLIEIVKNK